MKVELKRSTPIEYSYVDDAGLTVVFTANACTVGGYQLALRIEAEGEQAGSHRLLDQAIALCGESCRVHLAQMDVEMLHEVIQAQVALYSGLDPAAIVDIMRAVKKKALASQFATSATPATS